MGYSLAAHLITILKVSPSDIIFDFADKPMKKFFHFFLPLF